MGRQGQGAAWVLVITLAGCGGGGSGPEDGADASMDPAPAADAAASDTGSPPPDGTADSGDARDAAGLDAAADAGTPEGDGGTLDAGDVDTGQPDRDGDGVPDAIDVFPDDPLEWADADGDGVGDNADCSDVDDTAYQLLEGYMDSDLDGVGAGALDQVCTGDDLLPYWSSLGSDCDDDNPNAWISCATCDDVDGDQYYVGCDAYLSIMGPDCDDGDMSVWRMVEVYVDSDGDGAGVGTGRPACLGQSDPLGFSAMVGDCDDDDELLGEHLPELPDDGMDNDCAADGDLLVTDDLGVYVAIDDGSCQDTTRGTRASPNCDLSVGIGFSSPGETLFVAEGTYAVSDASLTDRVVAGGYGTGTWTPGAGVTIIESPTSRAFLVRGRSALTRLTIHGQAYGVVEARDGALLLLVDSTIDASFQASGTGLGLNLSTADGIVVRSTIAGANAGLGTGSSTALRSSGGRLVVADSTVDARGGSTMSRGLTNSGPTMLRDTVISGGTGAEAMGVASRGPLRVERCTIDAGTPATWGTGLGSGGPLILLSSYVRGSTAVTADTRGLSVSGSGHPPSTLANNTIEAGLSTDSAIAARFQGGVGPDLLVNNIFVVGASTNSIGVILLSGAEVRLISNDFWLSSAFYVSAGDGTGAITPSQINACVYTGCAEASGNVSVDPMFQAGAPPHLDPASSLIDAGADPSLYSVSVPNDIDRDLRPAGTTWDIGADEVQ